MPRRGAEKSEDALGSDIRQLDVRAVAAATIARSEKSIRGRDQSGGRASDRDEEAPSHGAIGEWIEDQRGKHPVVTAVIEGVLFLKGGKEVFEVLVEASEIAAHAGRYVAQHADEARLAIWDALNHGGHAISVHAPDVLHLLHSPTPIVGGVVGGVAGVAGLAVGVNRLNERRFLARASEPDDPGVGWQRGFLDLPGIEIDGKTSVPGQRVSAWLDGSGRFAIHAAADGWHLTHRPTGMRLDPSSGGFSSATMAGDYAGKVKVGADWNKVDVQSLRTDPVLAQDVRRSVNAPVLDHLKLVPGLPDLSRAGGHAGAWTHEAAELQKLLGAVKGDASVVGRVLARDAAASAVILRSILGGGAAHANKAAALKHIANVTETAILRDAMPPGQSISAVRLVNNLRLGAMGLERGASPLNPALRRKAATIGD